LQQHLQQQYSLTSDSGTIKTRTAAQVRSDIGAAASSDLSNYLPLSGGTLTGALSGTSANFSSTIQGLRFSSGGAVYPNVAYAIRGTITGNNDSWGIYQNVEFAVAGNSATAVGYHAGGSSYVNTGTFNRFKILWFFCKKI